MKSIAKSILCAVTLVLLLAVSASTGCTKKIPVDTTKLDYSFQTADQPLQTSVSEAIEAIEKKNYSDALEKLKKVAADPKLNAEQKSNVTQVIETLEKH